MVVVAHEKRSTVTRKPGESPDSSDKKFRSAQVLQVDVSERNGPKGPWVSINQQAFSSTLPSDYRAPQKHGVMADRLKQQREKTSKPFLGRSTNQACMTMTAEETQKYFELPLREAMSVVAVRERSKFGKPPNKASLVDLVPKEILEEEKKRLAGIQPRERVFAAISNLNKDGYTGHCPQSPKNARGPVISGPETTSGCANLEGLGQLLQ